MSITSEKLSSKQVRNKVEALSARRSLAMQESYQAAQKLAQIQKELERVQQEQCPHSSIDPIDHDCNDCGVLAIRTW
jgi:hypothetical protein